MEMRCNNLFLSFCRVALSGLFVCLWSCDGDPFGSDSREIAHDYRLKRIGNSSQFALLAPYDTGGIIIDEIGWGKPFIIARAVGSNTGTESTLIMLNTFALAIQSECRIRFIEQFLWKMRTSHGIASNHTNECGDGSLRYHLAIAGLRQPGTWWP